MSTSQYIAIMAVLILLSAYSSATETAFSTMNKTRLKTMIEKGNKKAKLALSLAENYDKLISTILVGNNIVNIATASIGTLLFVGIYGDMGATISTVVVTILVLIFGEVTPKSIAKDMPEKFAMFSAPIMRVLITIFTPITFLFTQLKKLIAKFIKVEESEKMSQEELLMIVDEVQQEGSLDDDESDLIKNAIEFGELSAEDILTHRVDLEAVPITAKKEDIAKMFWDTRFSRLLVYEDNIDNIVGVIHLKDFYTEDGIIKKDIKSIITKPLFVQKSEKINDLLKILQKNKSHIAVIIDEYGGTLGIVTMEDILEELVGEIWDEHDEIVEDFKKIDDDTFLVDGSLNFDDFSDFFNIVSETESISVGGWAMEQLGKIAEKGDSFEYDDLSITICETDSHRVTKLKIVRLEKCDNDTDDE